MKTRFHGRAGVPLPDPLAQSYFPRRTLGGDCARPRDARLQKECEGWNRWEPYTGVLGQMGEPRLPRDVPGFEAIRVVVVPPFLPEPAVVLRASLGGGDATLVTKVLQRTDASGQGRLEWMRVRRLSSAEWSSIEQALRQDHLWSRDTLGRELGPGEGCFDPGAGLVELVRGTTQHLVVLEPCSPMSGHLWHRLVELARCSPPRAAPAP